MNKPISKFDYEMCYLFLAEKDYVNYYQKILEHHPKENPSRVNFKKECLNFLGHNAFNDLCIHSGYDTLHNKFLSFSLGKNILCSHPESFLKRFDKKWFCLSKGFQNLSCDLHNFLVKKNCSIHLGYNLHKISKMGQRYVLSFFKEEKIVDNIVDKIILAMSPLQLITSKIEILGKDVLAKDIVSVPLFKCFLHFRYNWWNELDFAKKCVILNNPMRKLYFNDKTNTIFFYVDGKSATFWKKVMAKGKKALINAVIFHVSSLLNLKNKIEPPQSITYKFWEQGIFFWRYGSKYAEENPQFLKILPHVYLCSDVLTSHSGWIEGSLVSSKSVVEDICLTI